MTEASNETTTEEKPKRKRAAKAAKPKKAAKAAKPKNGETKSIVDPKYLDRFQVSDVKTASGKRKAMDINDRIAAKLRGLDVKEVQSILKSNDIELPVGFAKRNPGLQRMAAGNMLRAKVRKGGKVSIDGQTVASL